jgi:DNA-binding transcriptional regulator YdaS (Cro superfamily)
MAADDPRPAALAPHAFVAANWPHAAAPIGAPWDHMPAAVPVPSAPAPLTPAGALRRAVVHCGGQSALASAIGVSQSHVWNWLSRRRVPAEHCPAIERATIRAVRCEELRPDVDWAYLRAVCEELAQAAPEPGAA